MNCAVPAYGSSLCGRPPGNPLCEPCDEAHRNGMATKRSEDGA